MTRPKRKEGSSLWVILHFKDGTSLEGTIENDLLALQPWTGGIKVSMSYKGAGRSYDWDFATENLESLEVLGVCGAKKLIDAGK